MTIIESLFLGLLQGLTEFLPVSSSGHLILAQKMFGVEANLFFDVMLHVGTLFAVLVVMRKSVASAVKHPLANKTLLYVALASVPTFAIAFVVKLFVSETLMENLLPIGFATSIVLIVLSSLLGKERVRFDEVGALPPLVTGVVQGIAVLPGLSRSGSTVSAMKLFGVNASDSAEFSFLLSIPVIVASAVVELYEVLKTGVTVDWLAVAVGALASFVSGVASISTVMKIVKRGNWIWFAVYLVIPLALSLIWL